MSKRVYAPRVETAETQAIRHAGIVGQRQRTVSDYERSLAINLDQLAARPEGHIQRPGLVRQIAQTRVNLAAAIAELNALTIQ